MATGNIASQSPVAGTQVKSGTPINLVVSNGPCSATVPDVIQETQSAASAAITATPGLAPSFTPVDCSQSAFDIPKTKIPANHYFMMGDCRGDSADSRWWGTLPASYVVGKVEVIVWRFGRPYFHGF